MFKKLAVFYEKAENFVAYIGVYKLMQRTWGYFLQLNLKQNQIFKILYNLKFIFFLILISLKRSLGRILEHSLVRSLNHFMRKLDLKCIP